MLAERIHEVPIGEIIAVLADDPAAENDVPAWCLMKSHDHVLTQPLERGWSILIRRGLWRPGTPLRYAPAVCSPTPAIAWP